MPWWTALRAVRTARSRWRSLGRGQHTTPCLSRRFRTRKCHNFAPPFYCDPRHHAPPGRFLADSVPSTTDSRLAPSHACGWAAIHRRSNHKTQRSAPRGTGLAWTRTTRCRVRAAVCLAAERLGQRALAEVPAHTHVNVSPACTPSTAPHCECRARHLPQRVTGVGTLVITGGSRVWGRVGTCRCCSRATGTSNADEDRASGPAPCRLPCHAAWSWRWRCVVS